MKRIRSMSIAVLALAAIGSALVVGAPSAYAANTLYVGGPGGFPTIQAAVNAANPGTTIIVRPGTYNESVVIQKNGIHVKGAPNQPMPVVDGTDLDPTGCGFGSVDGFCITPAGGPFTSPPVQNVEIDHMVIQNFEGNGILAITAVGLNFHDNTVIDALEYGIARFDSSQTQIVNNTVTGAEEAGIYVGDSPNASTLVRRNNVSGNGFGIFLRDAAHGTVTENTANGNCFGIFLLDTGSPGDVFDWTLVHNTANENNVACPPSDEAPPLSGGGIVMLGLRNSRLTANTTDNNVPGGPSFASGGIVALDGGFAGGGPLAFLQIDNNHSTGNAPSPPSFDLNWDGTGNKVVFAKNTCVTSDPGGLC